jgi:signal transduction histidine kinase
MNLREVIARDLHDSVAQSLAGTRYWLQSLKLPDGKLEIDPAQFAAITEALDQEHASLREVIEGLRLGGFGNGEVDLIAQVERIASPLSNLWNMEITIEAACRSLMVNQMLAHGVLQFLREAASNAARHGQASAVRIMTIVSAMVLEIAIVDNGVGFRSSHLQGLPKSLRERAAQMGGAIELSSVPGNTRITLLLPIGET